VLTGDFSTPLSAASADNKGCSAMAYTLHSNGIENNRGTLNLCAGLVIGFTVEKKFLAMGGN